MISIIVPVFNVKKHLNRCLDSIIKQSFIDTEVILIDDGSSDGSELICEDYSKKDNRFKVIHTENKGISNARNIGLQNAKGEYILMVDGDDYLHPSMIDSLWKLINSRDYDFSMCYGKRIFDNDELEAELQKSHSSLASVELSQGSCLRDLYLGGNDVEVQYHVVWNKLYKRKLLENLFFQIQRLKIQNTITVYINA